MRAIICHKKQQISERAPEINIIQIQQTGIAYLSRVTLIILGLMSLLN
jgi:hypothetical protein